MNVHEALFEHVKNHLQEYGELMGVFVYKSHTAGLVARLKTDKGLPQVETITVTVSQTLHFVCRSDYAKIDALIEEIMERHNFTEQQAIDSICDLYRNH